MDYTYYGTAAHQAPIAFFNAPSQTYDIPDDPLPNGHNGFPPTNNGYDYSQFPQFDQPFIPPQHQPSPPNGKPRPSVTHASSAENALSSNSDFTNGHVNGLEFDPPEMNGNVSSSEEKDNLTPAQSRRKAQNRAAQRAFRERKERHVKDLETKLSSLEAHSATLLTDNERLKAELSKLSTQNEILRAKSAIHPSQIPLPPPRLPSPVAGPQTYSPRDFAEHVGVNTQKYGLKYDTFASRQTGEKLLAPGAAWDYIRNSDEFRRGTVELEDIMRRLKGRAACDGQGPAFREVEIRGAIEESVRAGGDELI